MIFNFKKREKKNMTNKINPFKGLFKKNIIKKPSQKLNKLSKSDLKNLIKYHTDQKIKLKKINIKRYEFHNKKTLIYRKALIKKNMTETYYCTICKKTHRISPNSIIGIKHGLMIHTPYLPYNKKILIINEWNNLPESKKIKINIYKTI